MLRKKSIIIAIVLAVLAVGSAYAYVKYVYPRVVEPAETYAQARNLYNSGNYVQAALKLESIPKYSDSVKVAKQAWKLAGDNAYNEGNFDLASACYEKAGSNAEDVARMDECYLRLAENAFENDMISRGEAYLQCVSASEGNSDRIDEIRINTANALLNAGVNASSISGAADRLGLCSEKAMPRVIELLVNRGKAALAVFDLDSANSLFNAAKRFTAEDAQAAFDESIASEWTKTGIAALERGMTSVAEKCFNMSGYVPEQQDAEAQYAKAEQLYANGEVFAAYSIFRKLGDYKNSRELTAAIVELISRMPNAGPENAYAMLDLDGTVKLYGDAWVTGEPNWTEVKQISVGKTPFILAVGNDGRVRSAGRNTDDCTNVSSWDQIVMASCGAAHSLGLRADGTVVFAGSIADGANNTASWREIVYIASGMDSCYGIMQNGRAVASGANGFGQCDVSSWENLKQISAGNRHAVGLREDGTVVACGDNTYGQCEVSSWTDVVFVSAGAYHTVALKADGTLLACGKNDDGECGVSRFNGAAAVSAGTGYTIIVFEDGTNRLIGRTN